MKRLIYYILPGLLLFYALSFCTAQSVFSVVDAASSGLHFSNNLTETKQRSILEYANFYGGGGVTIADLNQDNIPDILAAGNQVSNCLYKGLGNLKFEKVNKGLPAIFTDATCWTSAISAADVNNDGLPDLYLARETNEFDLEKRKDVLLINKGNFSFEEQTEAFNLKEPFRTRSAAFFDYNKDGFADLVLLVHPPNPGTFSDLNGVPWDNPAFGIRIFKNVAGKKFEEVTTALGINHPGYPNAIGISDLNNDGWVDFYVSGDFESPDYLFINKNGTGFQEVSKTALRHTSYFGMGVSIADINDDGWNDIFVLDMVAPDNFRIKSNMSGMNPQSFWETVKRGYHHQYMYNTLQLNQGISPQTDTPQFSDVAFLCDLNSTDWSWSNLIADFNNDGRKDIFITNGILRDIRNTDAQKKFSHYLQEVAEDFIAKNPNAGDVDINNILDLEEGLAILPSNPISNIMFSQKDKLVFDDVSEEWGLNFEGYSTGAAYGDLDNDGDLDIVINNTNEPLSLYKNNTVESGLNNFIRFKINSKKTTASLLGTKIKLTTSKGTYWNDLQLAKGMYSQSEALIHFGLPKGEVPEKAEIFWPGNLYNSIVAKDLVVNAVNTISDQNTEEENFKKENKFVFTELDNKVIPQNAKHKENQFDDFGKQVLLPHQMSRFGAAIATGDINGDGLEDFFLGAAAGEEGKIFIQKETGHFEFLEKNIFKEDAASEDMAAMFFDVDNDGDLDLYVVSGGNEWEAGSSLYQDRIYYNEAGRFIRKDIVENSNFSGAVVRPFDFDQDGDLDLFVGGRLKPWSYPEPADSKIYKNENGKLVDVTEQVAKEFLGLGMVTDAVWSDINGDNRKDLIVVGEWMPVTVFLNQEDQFVRTAIAPLQEMTGWWFSITASDLDGDGDDDYILGNLGLNYKYKATKEEPFAVNYYDFDENNTPDIVLSYYNYGIEYPLRGRSCSSQQVPGLQEKFPSYNEFAAANLFDAYGQTAIENSLRYEANSFASCIAFNDNGQFDIVALPREAQISSINDALVEDWNGDGQKEIFVAGNLYAAEIETPRNDAFYGLLLTCSKKNRRVAAVHPADSHIYTKGDVKSLHKIKVNNKNCFIIGNNNDAVQIFCP